MTLNLEVDTGILCVFPVAVHHDTVSGKRPTSTTIVPCGPVGFSASAL